MYRYMRRGISLFLAFAASQRTRRTPYLIVHTSIGVARPFRSQAGLLRAGSMTLSGVHTTCIPWDVTFAQPLSGCGIPMASSAVENFPSPLFQELGLSTMFVRFAQGTQQKERFVHIGSYRPNIIPLERLRDGEGSKGEPITRYSPSTADFSWRKQQMALL